MYISIVLNFIQLRFPGLKDPVSRAQWVFSGGKKKIRPPELKFGVVYVLPKKKKNIINPPFSYQFWDEISLLHQFSTPLIPWNLMKCPAQDPLNIEKIDSWGQCQVSPDPPGSAHWICDADVLEKNFWTDPCNNHCWKSRFISKFPKIHEG